MARHLIVEADGGSRGNPGPAGLGAVVRDPASGQVLAEVSEPLGSTTNNVAEYRGLIAGLKAAARIDADAAVEARLDSKLVVEQLSGRWKIKQPHLQPLAAEAREVAAGFTDVRYTWVPRAQNAHADRLANEAMDDDAAPVEDARRELPAPVLRSTGWADPDTTPTRLLLLRHGQTPLSADRRFAGTGDFELTDTGRHQAAAAARRLAGRGGIDAVVSSPLRRCRDTAAEAAEALGQSVEVVDGFRETDFGEWEGMTFAEVRARWPEELSRWLADPALSPPGGESFAAAARRVGLARDHVLAEHAGKTVLVVSHVTPIKVLVQQALLAPIQALYRMHLDVACLSEVDCYSDGPAVVRSLNDTAHLSRSDAPALG